ncbi:transmembrane protein 71 [Colossoma macropomum]|uniref:transmembrane protein 71 n=1 Tax=Colossoma macropomum TaxID=42526 RepID=UPI0018643C9D|nr:transmembrane protein 71 [Colossoma macropomum]
MALFFRGAVTSSPIKTRSRQDDQTCYSFDSSFLSDCSYECFSTNPVTGSVCVCRRSPRLLANGYYVLTEDSFDTDDQGNLTLTPTQTNISYKENLVRVFRRRRKVRRSLASLLSDVSQSCQSWLGERVFGRADSTHISELPSWLDISSSTENDTPVSFKYDPTETFFPPEKEMFLPEEEPHPEVCSAHEMPSHSETGLLDVPPPSECLYKSYCPPTYQPSVSDCVFLKAFLFFILTLCLCAAVFSKYGLERKCICVFGGVAVAVAFLFLISSICASKSVRAVRWSQTKTEDITSRNE